MRKTPTKAPSRPSSSALEVINFGTTTTGDSISPGSSQLTTQESISGRLSAPGTPKKTVNLVAVKRKEEPSSEDLTAMARLALADPASAEAMCSIATDTSFRTTATIRSRDSDRHSSGSHLGGGDKESSSSSNDSSDGDDSDSNEDPTKAPNEMKLEFLDCIMKKDFQTAAKLCRMILIYEPNNSDALGFQAAIQQKIEQDASNGLDEGSSSSDEDSDSSGDDTDDDDSSDDDDEEKSNSNDSTTDDNDDDDDEEGSTDDEESGSLANGGPTKCNGVDSHRR